ncbi:MAG: YceI family protein, partial [Brumimicrobium sp.]
AAFVFAALGLTACNSGEEKKDDNTENKKDEKVETVKYTLNADESELSWKGSWVAPGEDGEMQEIKSHEGTVEITEGKVKVKGDDISGSFKVDMTTITNEDLSEEDGKESLENHLKGTLEDKEEKNKDFFQTDEFATVDVKLKSIKEGEASLVINIMGTEIEETVPVMTKTKGDKMMIKGDFTIDLSSLELKGMQPNPEKPEEGSVNSKVDFTLNAVLNKK